MSISGLANIAMPNIPLPSQPISAATTRILALTNFSPQIKTKDLHQAFQPWAEDKGGYKIKWIDDVTALAVFNDATTAKRAYLSLILNPPANLPYPAVIRPYDGPDSSAIIHSVNARTHGHGGNRGSFSQAGGAAQARASFSQPAGQPPMLPFGNPSSSSVQQPFGVVGNGHKHGRSASLSSTSGNHERPNFGSIGGNAAGSSAFGKLGAGGAFSGFGTTSGSSGSLSNHVRNSSSVSSSNIGGSWGRQTAASNSVASGFNPSRLATHHEQDSPQTTPVKPNHQANASTANSAAGLSNDGPHPLLHLPQGNSHADLSSPGIDILGAVGPEGGPGGSAGIVQ
ncbi:hypothetical protein HD553DRAFT_348454 [Filobasidium floriforme]|uniref:uncharacterized protein n=1 Tax=Filobasidium floriforme TaxID=5210 RepID=UPI001E8EA6F0|nr:uncharacterized protein HD553DRAFT_348454 [Filobasidium floriforme]KAH8087897.1 hypothetical protein HD553DRAFT_348454 [Filobasidium floriforme]